MRKSTTLLSLCLAVLGFFALTMLITTGLNRAAHAQVEGGRLITVHDRGEERSFISTEETLGEALEENGFVMDPNDAVEPSADEKLVAPSYQVNIYRARPVTVIDGALRQKIVTPYQTAERIVEDAGIALHADDDTSLSRSTDFVGDGAGLRLIIDRATPVMVDLYGKKTELRTQAGTVKALLEEKNISLGEYGRASLPLDTTITAGMELRIWREGKQTITAEEVIEFEVEQVKDADRPVGYKQVQTAGKTGKRTVTYEIDIVNGQEKNRVEIASIVAEAPVKQVEIIGSKPSFIPYTGGGSKTDWLAASSIPQDMWGYADFMVQKESGWNPNAMNKSSGACGLAQALPCSKLGPNWNDPVVALNWMNSYVNGRYGGWEGAHSFWLNNRWY